MILAGDFISKNLKVRLPKEFGGQLVLANLEGPICADGLPRSNKVGVCLHTKREMFECSECSNVRMCGGVKFAFSLANNHMMDFQEEGLRQTEEFLVARNIPFAGAGADEAEARKPMILEENGKRIAVFSCCERQFGMATADSAGCAEKGVWLYSAVREIKKIGVADRVIVSCHAASEFCPWPSPDLRAFYHSLVDAGADIIHGHHAHVPQGWEVYKGCPIFYGLGNFVVDPARWGGNHNQLWSLVVCVQMNSDKVHFEVKACSLMREGDEIGTALSELSEDQARYVALANEGLKTDAMLESVWQEASCRLYPRLYSQCLRAVPVANRKLSMRDRLRKLMFVALDLGAVFLGCERVSSRSRHYGKVLYNYLNCESHVEMMRTALGVHLGVLPDRRNERTKEMADAILKK